MAYRIPFVPRLLLPLAALLLALPASAQVSIVIDGVNDFPPAQAVSGGDGSTWYFASDSTHFYFGLSHPDVGSMASDRFLTLYLDTDPQPNPLAGNGTTAGVSYGTQQPTLPFRADTHIRWRADDAFEGVLAWDGSGWLPISTDLIGAVGAGAGFVEFGISRSDLASPESVSILGALVQESAGNEASYAFVPPTTMAGYDPDPVDFLPLSLFSAPAVPGLGLLGSALLAGLCGVLGHRARRIHAGAQFS